MPAAGAEPVFEGLDRGWVVLRKALISGPGEPPTTIDIVLLHAGRGVALLEAPPHWTPDAPERLRRRLERACFTAIYPGYLPVVHAQLLRGALSELPRVLTAAFEAEPPLDLPGGDAWMLAVCRALTATPIAVPEAAAPPAAPPMAFRHGHGALAKGLAGMALVAAMGGAFLLLRPDLGVKEPARPAATEDAAGLFAGAGTPAVPAETSIPPRMALPALLRLAPEGTSKEATQAAVPPLPVAEPVDAAPADPPPDETPPMAPGEPLPHLPDEMPPAIGLLAAAEMVPAPPGPLALPAPTPAPPLLPAAPPTALPGPVPAGQAAGAVPALPPDPPGTPVARIPLPPEGTAEPPAPAALAVAPQPSMPQPDRAAVPSEVAAPPRPAEPPPDPQAGRSRAATPPAAEARPQPGAASLAAPSRPAGPVPPDARQADRAAAPPTAEAKPQPATASVTEPPRTVEPTPPDAQQQPDRAATPPAAEAKPQPTTASLAAPPQPSAPVPSNLRPTGTAAVTPPDRRAEPARLAAMLRRGDELLAIGDVSGARRFYERAAEAGSAEGARAAGRTHDPAVLAALGVRGIRPDPEAAAAWYRRAESLAAQEPRR